MGNRPNLKTSTQQENFYDEYRNSTVYFLQPDTKNIHLYNLKDEKFEIKSLAKLPTTIPKFYSTVQRIENDSIYMIGGLSPSVGDEFNLLSSCY
jgi:hypothetical protein